MRSGKIDKLTPSLHLFLAPGNSRNCSPRQSDTAIGLSLMDRFTSAMLDFFQEAMAKGEDKAADGVRGFSAATTLRDYVGVGCDGVMLLLFLSLASPVMSPLSLAGDCEGSRDVRSPRRPEKHYEVRTVRHR